MNHKIQSAMKRGKRASCKVKGGLKGPCSSTTLKSGGKQTLLTGKKKRNTDPGIRHQGGRIYDSELGTTCHQCRQKTIEVKAPCKSAGCGLQFCPRCLLNRYNEVVDQVRKQKRWKCPRCRKICNCSCCRKKQGLQATGILASIAKSAGFGSVSQLLEKNPHIVRSHVDSSKRKKNNENTATDRQKCRPLPLPSQNQTQAYVGVDDCKLKRRKRGMPQPIELKIHTKGASLDVPKDIDDGKLVCILEFFSTFGGVIGLKKVCLHSLVQSLLYNSKTCHTSSIAEDALSKLKKIICEWFGNCDPDNASWDSWVVDRYLNIEAETICQSKRRSERTCVKKQRSFWSLDILQRMDVVYSIIHEALECGPIVDVIEQSIDEKGDMCSRQKNEIEKIKKEIKEEQEQHTQRFIAELISSQHVNSLSAEKQHEIIQKARSDSISAISEENKSRLRWLRTSEYLRTHPSARRVALGQDRDGQRYYSLSCAKVITGTSSGIVCVSENDTLYYDDIKGLQDALDVSGEREGVLRMALRDVEKR